MASLQLYTIGKWIRRKRSRIIGCFLFLLVVTLLITIRNYVVVDNYNDPKQLNGKILNTIRSEVIPRKKTIQEFDAIILNATGSLDTPSSVYVIPDKNTTKLNPRNSRCYDDNGSKIFTLFIMISSPGNTQARRIVRNGLKLFLSEYDNSMIGEYNELLFLIGIPHSKMEMEKLESEVLLYQDIIIEDFEESYYNLALKSLRMLKWVQLNCNRAKYLVKIDDDIHFNLHMFFTFLRNLKDKPPEQGRNLIGGLVSINNIAVRDPNSEKYGKWYAPLVTWPNSTYPPHVSGVTYILGMDARQRIYKESLRHHMLHLEDVFLTGIIGTKALGLNLTDLPISLFHFNQNLSPCDMKKQFLAIHLQSNYYLECWSKFNKRGHKCEHRPVVKICLRKK